VAKLSALLDACVIFPYCLSDVLLTAAEEGLYQIYFSRRILDEAVRNRVKEQRMSELGAKKFQEKLIEFFPEAAIEAPLEMEAMMTNDPKDRHVLASAICAKVDVIVTNNLRDFPEGSLILWNIKAMSADSFLELLCDKYGDDLMYEIVAARAAAYRKPFRSQPADKTPPVTDIEMIEVLAKEQPKFADRLLSYKYGNGDV
jgi:predicted nucleic acid-binding protein